MYEVGIKIYTKEIRSKTYTFLVIQYNFTSIISKCHMFLPIVNIIPSYRVLN